MQNFGVVIIGRNEGERLKRCLRSLGDVPRVYVDSGSTDGSVSFAGSIGVHVVELDTSEPFTAARARNTGFNALIARHPDLELAMFVDGDCEVVDTWFAAALPLFASNRNIAAVCGRRRERFPEKTLYNLLCDIEWDTPVGEAAACGGDAMYRTSVFKEVGGFDGRFIAGEEPELCFRIRQKGYRIFRIDEEMTLHDADMTRFSQWWKRSKRSGYAYFLNTIAHGGETGEKFKRKEVISIAAWAGAYCSGLFMTLLSASPYPLLILFALILMQTARMTLSSKRVIERHGIAAAGKFAVMVMIGKIPQLQGIVSGMTKTLTKRQHTLVEYK